MGRGACFDPKKKCNFFVNIDVDGRATDVNTGPRDEDGGIFARFFIRDKGEVKEPFRVVGSTTDNEGKLTLSIILIEKFEEQEAVGEMFLSLVTER